MRQLEGFIERIKKPRCESCGIGEGEVHKRNCALLVCGTCQHWQPHKDPEGELTGNCMASSLAGDPRMPAKVGNGGILTTAPSFSCTFWSPAVKKESA